MGQVQSSKRAWSGVIYTMTHHGSHPDMCPIPPPPSHGAIAIATHLTPSHGRKEGWMNAESMDGWMDGLMDGCGGSVNGSPG